MTELLSGKKTYLVAIVALLTAAYQILGPLFGYSGVVPDAVYAIEAALGLGALRVAVTKSDS